MNFVLSSERPPNPPRLPAALLLALRRQSVRPTRHVLVVRVASQAMWWFEQIGQPHSLSPVPAYHCRKRFGISTSRFGIGQVMNSNRTPLGLHRVAEKIGGGQPIGTVFRSRQPVGLTWRAQPDAAIVHRILWLDGLEPGFNRGGNVDTHTRYIYLHGFSDETTLGRPQSRGCIHVAAADLLPLFDRVTVGTLVWIAER